MPASLKRFRDVGPIAVDSDPIAFRRRIAPMLIAVHRRGVVGVKKRRVCSTETRSLPIERIYAYTPYLYPHFHLTHFGTTCENHKTTS